jgi:hypothetical protein
VACVQAAKLRGLLVRAGAGGADRVAAAAVLLDELLPSFEALVGRGEPRCRDSQSHQAVPGAHQRGIEQERHLEVRDRLLLAALSFVDIARLLYASA